MPTTELIEESEQGTFVSTLEATMGHLGDDAKRC